MKNPFARKVEQKPEDVEVGGLGGLIREVWNAPADYNRASRRAARLWGRIWRWDPQALGIDPNLPPRYVRRHYKPDQFTTPKTRRQRKARARILRAMKVQWA